MVNKKGLLLILGTLWFVGGFVLVFRGLSGIFHLHQLSVFKLMITVLGSILFYVLVFHRVSSKYIRRINELPNEMNPFYVFMSVRSLWLMILMISVGVSLRVLTIIPFSELMYFYPVMGTVLLVSAIRFYWSAIVK